MTCQPLVLKILGVDTMIAFSEKVTALRQQNDVTQKQLATDLAISERNYQRLEAGGTTPTVPTVIKLCRYFNVSADYLLGLSDESVGKDDSLGSAKYPPR
jgi:transcriptional regulator with XRE-family HTH domain